MSEREQKLWLLSFRARGPGERAMECAGSRGGEGLPFTCSLLTHVRFSVEIEITRQSHFRPK